MGKVIQLRPTQQTSSPEITWEGMVERVNTGTVPKVQDRLIRSIGSAGVNVPTPQMAEASGEIGPAGVLYPVSNSPNLVISHVNFPRFLVSRGLDVSTALDLVACNVVSYNFWNNWWIGLLKNRQAIVNRAAQKSSNLPSIGGYWEPLQYEPLAERQSSVAIIHRMAARTAMDAAGVRDFEPDVEVLPVHMAALAEPLPERQVREIFRATQIYS
jgi:hypothetical protein